MTKTVYISGKITGTSDYMERFKLAEDKLKAQGYKVVNPAYISSLLPELSHEEYMEIDLLLLKHADILYQLEDWQYSKGANQEYGFAMALGMEIVKEINENE